MWVELRLEAVGFAYSFFSQVNTHIPAHTPNTGTCHQRYSQGLIPGCFCGRKVPHYLATSGFAHLQFLGYFSVRIFFWELSKARIVNMWGLICFHCKSSSTNLLVLLQLQTGPPLDEMSIASILRDLLHAIEYLHNEGKIHRDIKGCILYIIWIWTITVLTKVTEILLE